MARPQEDRRKARSEYVFARKSAPHVALVVGVSAATIQRWKREARAGGDDWDKARAAHLIAGEGLEAVLAVVIEEFVLLAQSTIEDIKTNEEMTTDTRVKNLVMLADAMTKATSSAGRLAPKISELGVAQDVISRLLTFVREHHPDHAEAMLEVLEPFGHELARAYA